MIDGFVQQFVDKYCDAYKFISDEIFVDRLLDERWVIDVLVDMFVDGKWVVHRVVNDSPRQRGVGSPQVRKRGRGRSGVRRRASGHSRVQKTAK